ncbi:MAG: transketolase family protein, partial [Clostridia bacterium]|nr:transketolase family protein [Clostridia bacterium]
VASHAGITVGEDGASHQAVEDLALMRALPQMTVIVPADAVQTAQAVRAAAAYVGPVYLRLGRPAVAPVYDEDYRFVWGRADVLREGRDASIVACGIMVAQALEAAAILAQEGIEVTVVNMAMIKPLDTVTLLAAARRTGAVVTAEEHSIIGGLGSAVAEVLGEEYPVPLLRVGLPDVFGESGRPEELLAKYGLTASHLVKAVHQVLARKRHA